MLYGSLPQINMPSPSLFQTRKGEEHPRRGVRRTLRPVGRRPQGQRLIPVPHGGRRSRQHEAEEPGGRDERTDPESHLLQGQDHPGEL